MRTLVKSPVAPSPGRARRGRTRALWLLVALAVLALALVASLAVGSRAIAPADVLAALLGSNADPVEATVVIEGRLPRTAIALAAGAALGVAGALIQALTRNPLADPGILGVNAGAAFAVAIAVGVLGVTSVWGYLWFAFGGAFAAAVLVYAVGSSLRTGARPVTLTLAGVALGAVLSGITSAMVLSDPASFQAIRAWESGSLAGRDATALTALAPFLVGAFVLALALAPSLNAVALGDDLARSLGARLPLVRVASVVVITVLAGGATAIAGPIAFIGLMVPHVARWIAGPDQRWIMAYTMVLAPILLLTADIVGRVVLLPGELPAGIVTAVLGAPVLIALVRRRGVSGL